MGRGAVWGGLPPLTPLPPPRLACGVVARAAGLFQNPKRLCSCDGLTLWEERDRAAGSTGTTVGPGPAGGPGPTAAPAPHL